MHPKKQVIFLFALIIIPPIIIFLSRQLFATNYIFSSLYKIIFLIPLIFRFFIEKKSLKQSFLENFSIKILKKNIVSVALIGLVLASIYFLAFLFLKEFLDLQIIAIKLHELVSLNLNNLLFIGAYIIIVNSLLEEYFWRGFMFEKLGKIFNPLIANVITAIAFTFHHIMFYYNWFTLTFFLIVTTGLIVYALMMNLIFQRYKDLFSCWLIHGFVDVVQIFIAFKVLAIV